ncbi:MAG: hypothetical protein HYS14_01890 [Candidatus Rokubacteria bacterium]|nr:hypothetical protein [Candidatus Rokubacteria bacterium]
MPSRPKWIGRGTTLVLAAVAVVACILFRRGPILNAALIVLVGFLGVRWLAHRTGGPFLERVVMGAYATVVLLAIALWSISAWRLPILSQFQLGGGFWTLAWDAYSYHTLAQQMLASWLQGTEFPHREHADFFVLTAAVYLLFGPHPLTATLLNAPLHAVVAIAAFRLGGQLSGPLGARTAAVLAAFWPQLLLWSAQLLRDPLALALLMTLLFLSTAELTATRHSATTMALRLGSFLVVMVALYRVRSYLAVALALSIGVILLTLLPRPAANARRLGGATALLATSLVAVFIGAHLDLPRLVAPAHAERGHLRLGIAWQRAGDHDEVAALRELVAHLSSGQVGAASALGRRLEPLGLDGAAQPPPPAESPAPASESALQRLWADLADPVRSIDDFRERSLIQGGTQVAPEVRFHSLSDVVAFLPRGLALVLFSPLPSEWQSPGGRTGLFKQLAAVEALLIYVLVLPLAVAGCLAIASGRPDRLLILVFVGLAAAGLALTVVNLGTLVRLRLALLLPAMALVGLGCQWLQERLSGLRADADAAGPS